MPTVSEILAQMLEDTSAPSETEKAAAAVDGGDDDDVVAQVAKELNLTPEEAAKVISEVEESEKHAEAEKLAEEATVLGRFMARGFLDELQKLGSDWEMGGGKKVQQQADASTPQEGSKVLAKVKAAIEAKHRPDTPTKDVAMQSVVKKIIATARKVKPTPAPATETNA
jgi:hypothetical protein